VERGICPTAESVMAETVIFQCACAKLPYFYFRSEIRRQHHVSRPPIWRGNAGDSRTFKSEIGIFMFTWILAQNGGFGAK